MGKIRLKRDSSLMNKISEISEFIRSKNVLIEFSGSNTIVTDNETGEEYYLEDESNDNISELPIDFDGFKLVQYN